MFSYNNSGFAEQNYDGAIAAFYVPCLARKICRYTVCVWLSYLYFIDYCLPCKRNVIFSCTKVKGYCMNFEDKQVFYIFMYLFTYTTFIVHMNKKKFVYMCNLVSAVIVFPLTLSYRIFVWAEIVLNKLIVNLIIIWNIRWK